MGFRGVWLRKQGLGIPQVWGWQDLFYAFRLGVEYVIVYWSFTGVRRIMEKKMETTVIGLYMGHIGTLKALITVPRSRSIMSYSPTVDNVHRICVSGRRVISWGSGVRGLGPRACNAQNLGTLT